jgi:hypothetical protein
MKKYMRLVFMALAAMLLLLALPGCDQSGDDGADPPPSSGVYENVEALADLAAIETGGTYTVILGSGINISDRWADISAAIRAAKKYVILDLSQCAVTDEAIQGSLPPGGNDFNIIKYNPYITGLILPQTLEFIDDSAFGDCTSLESVILPDGLLSIGIGAFRYCSGLSSITIPDSVATIGGQVFYGCSGLQGSITLPSGLVTIQSSAFYGCSGLSSITLPSGLVTIQSSAFYGCSSLSGITIPDTVVTIETGAFVNCTNLSGIVIPAGVTSIGGGAFQICTGLGQVTFSARSAALSIAANAFNGCTGLDTVVFEDANATIVNNNSFPSTVTSLKTAYEGGGAGTYTLSAGSWSKN